MSRRQEAFTAEPGNMREFLIKVNADVEFRKRFLKDPIVVLNNSGFTLSPKAKSEVEFTVKCLNKDVSDIAGMPTGLEEFLRDMGYKGKLPPIDGQGILG